jgi:antitoxin HicB
MAGGWLDQGDSFMSRRYTVSDGKVVLTLEAAEEGGYVVTSPLDPELITQAETIEEAFANARDATQALKQARAKLLRRLAAAKASE